ncbi:hypothetical protein HA402_008228 [Bradysia odoriphaga]|nr:hypothetical protein HA402_008228 [Bradysia odoriphaga]
MKFKKQFTFIVFILTVVIIWTLLWNRITTNNTVLLAKFNRDFLNTHHTKQITERMVMSTPKAPNEIVISVVSCGMRLQETLNMLKSALMFNVDKVALKFIIVTETSSIASFREKLEDWLVLTKNEFTFEILPLTFPEKHKNEWKNLFKPCAAQRLFLPSLLSHIDSVLYVDTDTLFLTPVSDIWHFFTEFNSTQIAGLSPEHEDRNVGWYNRFAKHPFYGPMGLNSGVMLMNLTRMRKFKWEEYILPLYKEFKLKITWGDQDLINILFYYHPDKLYLFPCEWNYRPDHCMYMPVCKAATGVKILHGNRGYFHADKQPIFSTTFRIIQEYRLGDDLYNNFLMTLESALADSTVVQSNCGKVSDKLLIKARELFKEVEYYYNTR